jgi:hypothetical protein
MAQKATQTVDTDTAFQRHAAGENRRLQVISPLERVFESGIIEFKKENSGGAGEFSEVHRRVP